MKQTRISDKLYGLILEIHENSDSYTKEQVQELLINNQYISFQLQEELEENERCPRCYSDLIHRKIGYEELEYGGMPTKIPEYQRQCSDESCGFVVE